MKRMTHWMYREIVARGSRKRKQQQVARKSRRDLPPRENQSRKQISFIWSPFISCHTVTTDILPIYTTWSLFNFRWYQKETLTKRNLSKRGYEESIIYVILSARNLKKTDPLWFLLVSWKRDQSCHIFLPTIPTYTYDRWLSLPIFTVDNYWHDRRSLRIL